MISPEKRNWAGEADERPANTVWAQRMLVGCHDVERPENNDKQTRNGPDRDSSFHAALLAYPLQSSYRLP
jgi:hypothetical protein